MVFLLDYFVSCSLDHKLCDTGEHIFLVHLYIPRTKQNWKKGGLVKGKVIWFSSVQSLSRVRLFETSWTAARQASLSEKAMATYSSTLTWKIPWMEEPGRLRSMGSLGVGHDLATSLSLFTFMHWRRKWQPTPVFLPGESQGRRSLVGCHLWGRTESDTTEVT